MGVTTYITHVRYTEKHVIAEVLHKPTGHKENRGTVVQNINLGVDYFTVPPVGGGAKIHVVGGKFISTDPNEKKSDNLGNLPEF